MKRSILFFCGQPLASTPIGQRIGAFGGYLRRQGWTVHLSAVDPAFNGVPFMVHDVQRNQGVEILGPTHYRLGSDGKRRWLSPQGYLMECSRISRRIRERAREMKADFIVLSTTLPASLLAAVLLPSRSCQVWMDIDDWSAGQFAARGGARLAGSVYGLLERVLPGFSRGITVCSKELQTVYPGAALVPNFIRMEEIPEKTADCAIQRRVRVAFASGVTAYHGHLPFLEALARRRGECAHVEFRIMGDGGHLDACRRFAEEHGLSGLVHFTGHLERRSMLEQLVASPIAILPLWDNRLNRARFPLKLLDYLACGCAIAASNAGMAREVLSHEETALLSEPGNMAALISNVLRLANNPDLRVRLSLQGSSLVRRYSEDEVCGKWMQLLEQAASPLSFTPSSPPRA